MPDTVCFSLSFCFTRHVHVHVCVCMSLNHFGRSLPLRHDTWSPQLRVVYIFVSTCARRDECFWCRGKRGVQVSLPREPFSPSRPPPTPLLPREPFSPSLPQPPFPSLDQLTRLILTFFKNILIEHYALEKTNAPLAFLSKCTQSEHIF